MRVWRMNLRRTKRAIISWPGSFVSSLKGIWLFSTHKFHAMVSLVSKLTRYTMLHKTETINRLMEGLHAEGDCKTNEPCHEIMLFFILRKLILLTRTRIHPVGLYAWFFLSKHTCTSILHVCEQRRLWRAWAFAVCLCDKYHNLMSWLNAHMAGSIIGVEPQQKQIFEHY